MALHRSSIGLALLRIFACFGVLPFVGCLYLVLTGGPSWSAVAYVLAGGILLAGLVTLAASRARGSASSS